MKKTMRAGFIRDLKASKGRFISIMLLMFISTFTLVGLKLVGPDIRATAAEYLNQYNLADINIMSTYGLNADDQEVIEQAVGDDSVEFGYFQDVTLGTSSTSLRIYSAPNQISKYELVAGKMPSASDQIAISNTLASAYPLGSTIEVSGKSSTDILTEHKFEVVGYVNSVEILSTVDLGQTSVGTGKLDGYGVVMESVFDSEVATIARISYQDLDKYDAFLDDYLALVANHKRDLEADLKQQPQKRLTEIKQSAGAEISDSKSELDSATKKLDDAQAELNASSSELQTAKTTLDDNQNQIANAEEQLATAQAEIDRGFATLDAESQKLETASATITTKRSELDSAQAQVTAARNEIDDQKAEVTANRESLETGLSSAQAQITKLEAAIAQLDDTIAEASEEQLVSLNAQRDQLSAQLTQAKTAYTNYLDTTYTPAIASLDQADYAITAGLAELDSNQSEIDAGYQLLDMHSAELVTGRQKLAASRLSLEQNQTLVTQKTAELESAKAQLEAGYERYNQGLSQYQQYLAEFEATEPAAREEITNGYAEIAEVEANLETLPLPVYSVYTRSTTPTSSGYQVFSSLATSVDKVANVFPILLYAVAALVTFTTMTRFVEDERINTGTLLSLGYTQNEIKFKYIIYGALSSSIGAILGIVLGSAIIPNLLYTAFRSEFTTPNLVYTFDFEVAIIAFIISILCAVVPAIIVTSSEFKCAPSSLLLPKPPANGSKILLERITFIWERLSFSRKVTARNIFRYKKRMFMTIFGVSGSVALLFTGLAMQGSIDHVTDLQFGQIIKYDMIAVGGNDLSGQQIEDIDRVLVDAKIASKQPVYIENVSQTVGANDERQEISLMVADDFSDYIDFRDRITGEQYRLANDTVIISERLAEILDLECGEQFSINSAQNTPVTLTVGAITEMYTGHYIFANKQTYRDAFGTEAIPNAYFINSKQESNELAIELLKSPGVTTIIQNQSLIDQVNSMAASLNSVMTLLVVLAVLLAVVILYNITNINVNERMRELSTTKVLGYYDNEVTMYIYRETIILSLIGIIVGFGFGRIIHLYMMKMVSPLNMMFDQRVTGSAFIAPTILIIVVSIVLGIIIHHRLKQIDMLEALKSVE